MSKAYLNCISGISGDMLLGAFVDAGVPLGSLKKELKKIPLTGFTLSSSEVRRKGIRANKVDVKLTGKSAAPARKLRDIKAIIEGSTLKPSIKKQGLKIFKRIFEAEAHVHGSTSGRVHLHELGAVDAIVDIMGTLICLDILKIDKLACSPINLGSGTVGTEHGQLPVPAPATAEMLKGVPLYSEGKGELATPTGAAIISTLCSEFGPMPPMSISATGTGAGSKEDAGAQPNVLWLYIGQPLAGHKATPEETVTVLETNIDDMSPEIFPHVMELLFKAGALDVWMVPIVMKKSRPAITLCAMCSEPLAGDMARIILMQTTSLGVRIRQDRRITLQRAGRKVSTPYGRLRVKDAFMDGKLLRSVPEYEEASKAALKYNVPLMDVMQEVKSAAKKKK